MRIKDTNLCIFRGGAMIKSGTALERATALITTAICELVEESYNPEIIKTLYDVAKAQYDCELTSGMECDNALDVRDMYNFILDIISVACCYMDDIRDNGDHDWAIQKSMLSLMDLLQSRICRIDHSGGNWYWDCDKCDFLRHCSHPFLEGGDLTDAAESESDDA